MFYISFFIVYCGSESNEIYQEEMLFLTYQSHVQNISWQDWVENGQAEHQEEILG